MVGVGVGVGVTVAVKMYVCSARECGCSEEREGPRRRVGIRVLDSRQGGKRGGGDGLGE